MGVQAGSQFLSPKATSELEIWPPAEQFMRNQLERGFVICGTNPDPMDKEYCGQRLSLLSEDPRGWQQICSSIS